MTEADQPLIPVTPLDASTVLLIRDSDDGIEGFSRVDAAFDYDIALALEVVEFATGECRQICTSRFLIPGAIQKGF